MLRKCSYDPAVSQVKEQALGGHPGGQSWQSGPQRAFGGKTLHRPQSSGGPSSESGGPSARFARLKLGPLRCPGLWAGVQPVTAPLDTGERPLLQGLDPACCEQKSLPGWVTWVAVLIRP